MYLSREFMIGNVRVRCIDYNDRESTGIVMFFRFPDSSISELMGVRDNGQVANELRPFGHSPERSLWQRWDDWREIIANLESQFK